MTSEDKGFIIENNILKGTGNHHPPVSKYTSLGKLILDNLKNDPSFVGQVDTVTGEEYTHEEMRRRSVGCALWMKKQGLRAGDVITICTHNHLDVAMPCFGALYLGAIFNPLDTGLDANDFRHLMKITNPKIAFVDEQLTETIARIAEEMKIDLKIIVFGQVPGFLEFEKIIAETSAVGIGKFEFTPIENADQTAVIMCTSGTTGPPKGVALGHSVFLNQITAYQESLGRHRAVVFTPLAWFTGTWNMIMSICTKSTRFVPPHFEEDIACELIERFKVTYVFAGPHMINRLLKSNAMNKYDLSNLEYVLCSGSKLAVASREAFTKLLPNVVFHMSYGTTEVGGFVAWQMNSVVSKSTGRIVGTCEMKVIDPTTGQTLGPNQQGEFLVKTNTMMNGYYNNPQATAQAVDEKGWYHSGDLGYYDDNGEVFIVDRLNEIIKYRGYDISPVEIEDLLQKHPGVKEVAVVGLPHPVDDEHPIAFVVKTDPSVYGKQVLEEELIDLVAAEVADYKKLRGGVKFIEALPKTASSKIQRRDVRALARSLAAT